LPSYVTVTVDGAAGGVVAPVSGVVVAVMGAADDAFSSTATDAGVFDIEYHQKPPPIRMIAIMIHSAFRI
jgi:hypothetical protein